MVPLGTVLFGTFFKMVPNRTVPNGTIRQQERAFRHKQDFYCMRVASIAYLCDNINSNPLIQC
jgi:hypothetical protein